MIHTIGKKMRKEIELNNILKNFDLNRKQDVFNFNQ